MYPKLESVEHRSARLQMYTTKHHPRPTARPRTSCISAPCSRILSALQPLVLYSHWFVFFDSRRMLLGQSMDGIERLCGSFDNEASAETVSMRVRFYPKVIVLT